MPFLTSPIINHLDTSASLNAVRLKAIYKTVWEIKQRCLVDMAVDRGAFIDQSQSLNVHMEEPTFGKLTSLHFYCWRKVSPPVGHSSSPQDAA